MRFFRGAGLAFLALFACAADAAAKWPKVKIPADSIRIGLPPGRTAGERDELGGAAHVAKMNMWAPVYFDIEILEEIPEKERADAYLHVRSQDSDGYATSYRMPLLNLAGRNAGEIIKSVELKAMPYIRLGGYLGECEFVIRNAKGEDLSETRKKSQLNPVDSSTYVVASLGSKLASFDVRLPDNEDKGKKPARIVTASMLDLAAMPDQWIGYDAVDMVILGTAGTKGFVESLFGEAGEKNPAVRIKRDALLEWVRRGGRLIVSVGSNAGLVSQYKLLNDLLPYPIDPANPKADYPSVALTWKNASPKDGLMKPKDGTVSVAGFRKIADRPVRVIMQTPYMNISTATEMPLIVQHTVGLGRVTVVGFDLDRSPFAEFPARSQFWTWLLKECGSEYAVEGYTSNRNTSAISSVNPEDDFASGLQRDIDRFEGVPVVSFGWVALFVILYTLVIGPIEYLILKKVFKKLELTWITFPLIVLTVSLVAYFSAYALKGSDLKLNKFDVVDIDPSSHRVYGRTWVGVFSPRIESYTVSVTPNAGWSTDKGAAADKPRTLVDWLAGNRSSRQSLFRSSYQYRVDANPEEPHFADALVDVPIKVWSVKSFSANWSAETDPAAPLIESKLVHPPGDELNVSGTFTHHLPFGTLKDVRLIYRGKVYNVGTVEVDRPFRVVLEDSKAESDWIKNNANLGILSSVLNGGDEYYTRGMQRQVGPQNPGQLPYWGMLFHEASLRPDTPLSNASLRKLDQSWRVSPENLNEILLVARIPATTEKAEELITRTNSPSPTQLWLKSAPGEGKKRTEINGFMRQETYIRAYIPVKVNSAVK
ncbi:MAG: hypothetical protein U0798_06185 [Gemmataceae bacterium]